MQYGLAIFKGGMAGVIKFTHATDVKSFARIFLKRRLKEEGTPYTKEGLKKYLQEWMECHNERCDEGGEVSEPSQVICEAADTLTYSNVHLQKKGAGASTWIPLTSDEKAEFCRTIEEVLEGVL